MYLVVGTKCWGRGKTVERAKRICQLNFGTEKMVNYFVYKTDDITIEVSPSGTIIRDQSSNQLEIIQKIENGVEVKKEKKNETKTEINITEEKEEKKSKKKK